MNHHDRDEWLRDVKESQRNIVFPGTTQNEGRFWRNAYSDKQRLTVLHWIGIALLFGTLMFNFVGAMKWHWPESQEPWWHKVVVAYGDESLIFGALLLFILVGNHLSRRRKRKNAHPRP